MIDDVIIDAVTKIGNHPKLYHPHVAFNLNLEKWMVERTLKALSLLIEEWDKLSHEKHNK